MITAVAKKSFWWKKKWQIEYDIFNRKRAEKVALSGNADDSTTQKKTRDNVSYHVIYNTL